MMKLFKVTYDGYSYGCDAVAFVFANDETDAIREVIDHEDTKHFNNVECEEVIKYGVIYNNNGGL